MTERTSFGLVRCPTLVRHRRNRRVPIYVDLWNFYDVEALVIVSDCPLLNLPRTTCLKLCAGLPLGSCKRALPLRMSSIDNAAAVAVALSIVTPYAAKKKNNQQFANSTYQCVSGLKLVLTVCLFNINISAYRNVQPQSQFALFQFLKFGINEQWTLAYDDASH